MNDEDRETSHPRQTTFENMSSGERRKFLAAGAGATTAAALSSVKAGAGQINPGAGQISQAQRGDMVLRTQGAFEIGGTVLTGSNGDTYHGDHAYVQYQIPKVIKGLPLVMWHGGGQMARTWESTPDGRDGYQNIFLRLGFPTYILDQPGRGRAGRAVIGTTIPNGVPGESTYFNIFRLGVWTPPAPKQFWAGTQFPRDALDQYWRQITPDTTTLPSYNGQASSYDVPVSAVSQLFEQIGPAVLLTHSASGCPGWLTAIRSNNVRAIVAYEVTEFVFPVGEVPTLMNAPSINLKMAGVPVSKADFQQLTKIPIQIVYGDNIPKSPSSVVGYDLWYSTAYNVKLFVDAINRHGGNATILNLPDIGIRGNTHFAFSDLNNIDVAQQMLKFLQLHSFV